MKRTTSFWIALCALADARQQLDASGAQGKAFRVFASGEGGAQHCQRDYLALVVAAMWSRLGEKLVRNCHTSS